ncbi:MAG TPA: tetratricopeptide repeat protein, partial [Kofleriaceae bacterium]|nr:tetratricopeptide repeat protein [Kofleriaceae bacterium]
PDPPRPAPAPPKADPPKPAPPPAAAKVDAKPPPKAKLVDPFPPRHPATEKPVKVASAPAHDSTKVDGETAYRIGLQQFARGDTSGALASLRTSLASNPNYPPTWRGLGLVFEKLGERDQARAAFKRYLQLAPGAPDGEQIRGRLERLGS